MTPKFQRLQTGEFRRFARAAPNASPSLMPSEFWHIYIKLDFQKRYENAETKGDGHSFVKHVARGASAAEISLHENDGLVIEVQGSVIHCLILDKFGDVNLLRQQCRMINNALHFVFSDSSIVEGWRMSADWGKTLLVRGRGIHNDDSYVSLGDAANAPAKHLYQQLAIPEDSRRLKRYMLGLRRGDQTSWAYDLLSSQIDEDFKNNASADLYTTKTKEFVVTASSSIQAKAVPGLSSDKISIQRSANPAVSKKNEETSTYFGWVMRADLDGFTARVESCYDDDTELLKLGQEFEAIMDKAAQFAAQHNELLIQLPWAGDNFTAVVTLPDHEAYQEAIERRYIEFILDFRDALSSTTKKAGLSGWAHTVAGGQVHGNAHGNVFVGSVEFEGRRFLIGAGQGIGRSTQAFADMNPSVGEVVLFNDDYPLLLKPYRDQFSDQSKHSGGDSSLFRKGQAVHLAKARQFIENSLTNIAKPAISTITIGAGPSVKVSSRPYANGEIRL